MELKGMERNADEAARLREEYVKTQEKLLGDPIGARKLSDEEFVQWFETKIAQSRMVRVMAMNPPMTDWFAPGTVIEGPEWFIARAMPSTENFSHEIARYTRLTGQKNPFKGVK